MKTFKQLPLHHLFLYKKEGDSDWRNDICVKVNNQCVNNVINMTTHEWVSFDQDDTTIKYGFINTVDIQEVWDFNLYNK